MARSVILSSLLAAGAYAVRVGVVTDHAIHERHIDATWPPVNLTSVQSGSVLVPKWEAPIVVRNNPAGHTTLHDLHGGAGRGPWSKRSGLASRMSKDATGYRVELPDDWKSATVNFKIREESGVERTPPKLVMHVANMIKDWSDLLQREWTETEFEQQKQEWTETETDFGHVHPFDSSSSPMAGSKAVKSRHRKEEIANAWKSLKLISEDIEANNPIHVFGLDTWVVRGPTDRISPETIQAVASVEFISVWDGHGDPNDPYGAPYDADHSFGAVHIKGIVSTPYDATVPKDKDTGEDGGVGVVGSPENLMLDKIIDFANQQGKMVTVSPANDEMALTYRGLGFEFMPTVNRVMMVYGGSRESELEASTKGILVDLIGGGVGAWKRGGVGGEGQVGTVSNPW